MYSYSKARAKVVCGMIKAPSCCYHGIFFRPFQFFNFSFTYIIVFSHDAYFFFVFYRTTRRAFRWGARVLLYPYKAAQLCYLNFLKAAPLTTLWYNELQNANSWPPGFRTAQTELQINTSPFPMKESSQSLFDFLARNRWIDNEPGDQFVFHLFVIYIFVTYRELKKSGLLCNISILLTI